MSRDRPQKRDESVGEIARRWAETEASRDCRHDSLPSVRCSDCVAAAIAAAIREDRRQRPYESIGGRVALGYLSGIGLPRETAQEVAHRIVMAVEDHAKTHEEDS